MASPIATCGVVATLLAVTAAPAQDVAGSLAADRRAGAQTIDVETLHQWLTVLASEELAGRGTGQPGFQKAAEFVRDRFKEIGLLPGAADGSYWQRVPWTRVEVDRKASGLTVYKGEQQVLQIPDSRLRGSVSVSSHKRGGLALLVITDWEDDGDPGKPPVVPELEDADLEGRVLLTYLHGKDGGTQQRARLRFGLTRQLVGTGHAAWIDVEPRAIHGGLQGRSRVGRGAGNRAIAGRAIRPTSISIGRPDLLGILAAAGLHESALSGETRYRTAELQIELRATVKEDPRPAFNVVGILRGRDPALRNEYVVVGSHLDHLGKRGGRYFPGADDDGSGTVGVLALAKALAANPPRRSVAFVTFCGEENGMVGSRFFVDNPPIPLPQIVAELQMDMIGRREESTRTGEKAEDNVNSLHLVGTEKLSRDLHALCVEKNQRHGFDLEWDEEGVFFRSDHVSFARHGIPIAFFFTGFHRDYHRATDTVDKIDFDKLRRVALYVYDLAFELGEREERPLVDEELWGEHRGRLKGPEQPVAPVRRRDGR